MTIERLPRPQALDPRPLKAHEPASACSLCQHLNAGRLDREIGAGGPKPPIPFRSRFAHPRANCDAVAFVFYRLIVSRTSPAVNGGVGIERRKSTRGG